MNYFALVPAAGSGSRMGAATPKQYFTLWGRPLIWHALRSLCQTPAIRQVYVVLAPDDTEWNASTMQDLGPKLVVLRCGGETRADSVAKGLRAMAEQIPEIANDWVLVHDAARPCLTVAQIETLIAGVGADAVGGILALPVADTLKRAGTEARIVATLPREGLWQAQTPQMFRHRMLQEALAAAPAVTDEAGAIEALGLQPRLIAGDASNLKVTWPHDLPLATLILGQQGLK